MIGVIVNSAAVIVGAVAGLFFHKFLPKKLGDTVMTGVALFVLYIGVDGMLEGNNPIVTVLSMVLGAIIGTILNLDDLLTRFGAWIEKKISRGQTNSDDHKGTLAEGFVTGTLLFCVGAMAVLGALSAGLRGDNTTLFAKAIMDGIASIFLASSLGAGVLLSAVSLLIYQGSITLLAGALQNVLSTEAIAEMTCVGSLLLVALALNMLGLTKIKVVNYLPAIFLPLLFLLFL